MTFRVRYNKMRVWLAVVLAKAAYSILGLFDSLTLLKDWVKFGVGNCKHHVKIGVCNLFLSVGFVMYLNTFVVIWLLSKKFDTNISDMK